MHVTVTEMEEVEYVLTANGFSFPKEKRSRECAS